MTPSGVVNDGNGGNNYTYTFVTAAGTINALAITVTAASDTKTYDGTTNSSAVPIISPGLGAGDTADFTEAYDSRNAGPRTLTPSGLVNDGNGGNNYSYTFVTASGTVTPLAITVTAASDSKTYDGTTTSMGVPTITSGSLATGDTTTSFTQVFDSRNAGSRMLLASGIVNDGNGGNNYSYTFVPASGTINQRAITVTAASDTKTYDGTTNSPVAPTITAGTLAPGDMASFTESFDTRNVGSGLTLTPAGVVNDGNGGNNYFVTFVAEATGVITARAITVTAAPDSKTYDGTTTSTGVPVITGGLGAGDVADFTQSFDSPDVGFRTLTPGGVVNDGNGGANYSYTFLSNAGTINQRDISVSADSGQTKVYGTTDPVLTYHVTSGSLVAGDQFSGSLSRTPGENVGGYSILQSTLTAGPNYALSFTSASFMITPRPITVTAVGASKVYDGTTSTAVLPSISAGTLAGSDVANFTESFATKNVGSALTLTPAGSVSDGNGGHNYVVTFVTNTTGKITPRAITVTAVPASKIYDGTTSSTAVPTISAGTLVAGDFPSFTESFGTKNVGTGLILTPAGMVNDGNGGNNYSVSFVENTTGVITPRTITVKATAASKAYDGTLVSSAVPAITTGTLAPGDVANFTESFATKNVGTELTLIPVGSVSDDNGGNNYTVTFESGTQGVITPRIVNVTADAKSKVVGQPDPALTYHVTGGSVLPGDSFSGNLSRVPGETAGNYPIEQGTLALDNNYTITYIGANLTILPLARTQTTILASSAPNSVYGELASFTAEVVPASGTGAPTGIVEFLDGSNVLGSSPLSGSLAVFSVASLGVASHSITAIYEGDGFFAESQSPAVYQKVGPAFTTTTILVRPAANHRNVILVRGRDGELPQWCDADRLRGIQPQWAQAPHRPPGERSGPTSDLPPDTYQQDGQRRLCNQWRFLQAQRFQDDVHHIESSQDSCSGALGGASPSLTVCDSSQTPSSVLTLESHRCRKETRRSA